uniref:SET domain-containing protein n=1 Tax=Candidatus Kentrum sp. MB TaxID=2138164 RepID=A0A451BAD1_9GAMM|nr:MAG: hypothetical protein BECKMB1821I_GA0114274_10186 [Candidatus Kentron sp. MB]VFK75227.1 MAG: hypothetical protein BECKMB1821H_GA0114242_10186 [Candidatus Kentron sp. MB]
MNDGYELKTTGNRGEGVFATRDFVPGETIMVGRILKRFAENNSHAAQIGENEFVLHSGIIHKINHSCEPNCGIRVNETGAHDVIVRKPIATGEELTIDYAMRNYRIEFFPERCLCGAPNCRGRITGWKDLPEARKREYQGFVASYLLELDKKYEHQA